MTTEEFIQKAKAIHGDKYDYSKVDYVNNHTKVIIMCPEHGEFPQNPHNHLFGNGCPKCARQRTADRERKTTEWFVEKARQAHGSRFDYSKVNYLNNHTPVIISCPIHGEFQQTPTNHLKGQGCPACGRKKLQLTQEEVLNRIASILEGTPYELVLPFEYRTDRNTSIKLRCTTHNEIWEMSWHSFMYDSENKHFTGCSGCRQTYSKEDCIKAAMSCSSRSEFASKYKGEYFKALRMNWLDEICAHMNVVGNRYKRCIYVYAFDQKGLKHVYVGLTGNIAKRDKEHRARTNSSVNKFALYHHIDIPPVQQVTEYLPKGEASQKEGDVLQYYLSLGYTPINKTKTGGLGGHLPDDGYTYEQCQEKALCYRNRSEWKEKDYSTYYVASKYGWIDTIMPQNKPYGNKDIRYWTIERCCEAAKSCVTISEFREKYNSAYVMVCKNKWNDVVFANIERLTAQYNYDLDTIVETLRQYESTADFADANPSMVTWLGHHKIKMRDIATPEQLHKSFTKGTKPIVQCDLDGNFVAEYKSAREPVGFDFKKISACCHGTRKSHKGYKWFFKEDYENQ